jgi:hypothetical protein
MVMSGQGVAHQPTEARMTTTLTAEQIIAAGGREWAKGGRHRIYVKIRPSEVGLTYTTYKTGNISSGQLDGDGISNAETRNLLGILHDIYYDVNAKGWAIPAGARAISDGDMADRIKGAVAARIAPKTIEASARDAAVALGVSVRTVQRRAAAGTLTARKDDRGYWVITLPAA